MGEAKRRGTLTERLQQSAEKKRQAEEFALERDREVLDYIEAMSRPLEAGEVVRFGIEGGYLQWIKRSGCDAKLPERTDRYKARQAAMEINKALQVVAMNGWGQVSLTVSQDPHEPREPVIPLRGSGTKSSDLLKAGMVGAMVLGPDVFGAFNDSGDWALPSLYGGL